MSAAVAAAMRGIVFYRDGSRCQWCGVAINRSYGDYSIQHRRARGMGGSKLDTTNLAANLVLLCGSATTGCHGYVESHREESIARGFTLWNSRDPKVQPDVVPMLVATAGLQRWERHDDSGGRDILLFDEGNTYMRSIGAVA